MTQLGRERKQQGAAHAYVGAQDANAYVLHLAIDKLVKLDSRALGLSRRGDGDEPD